LGKKGLKKKILFYKNCQKRIKGRFIFVKSKKPIHPCFWPNCGDKKVIFFFFGQNSESISLFAKIFGVVYSKIFRDLRMYFKFLGCLIFLSRKMRFLTVFFVQNLCGYLDILLEIR